MSGIAAMSVPFEDMLFMMEQDREYAEDLSVQGADEVPPVPVIEPVPADLLSVTMTAERYKEMIASLSAIGSECRVHITTEGIYCMMVDVANVAMIIMNLPAGYFECYRAPGEMAIGLDVASLKKLGTMVKKGDSVTLTVHDEKRLTFEGAGTTVRGTLLDQNTIRKDPNRPSLEFNTEGTIDAGSFMTAIADIKKITDKVVIEAKNGNVLSLSGETDTTKINKVLQWSPSLMAHDGARSLYSMEYLSDMVKTFNKKEQIRILYRTDYPIVLLRENVAGIPGARIEYLLAPRIETD